MNGLWASIIEVGASFKQYYNELSTEQAVSIYHRGWSCFKLYKYELSKAQDLSNYHRGGCLFQDIQQPVIK